MVNFIVVDDNKKINKNVIEIIDKVMMKNKHYYNISSYFDYDKNFRKQMKEKTLPKVYILDLETPTSSGIDMAREIREKDIDSIIIFLTGHEELGSIILKSEVMFLTFISKYDKYEKRLEQAITKSLIHLNKREIMRFNDNGSTYTIPLKDILYITRDSIERKCILKTEYAEFKLSKNLSSMTTLLNDDFIQTHRACIVNITRIRRIKYHQKEIMFDNGDTIDLISSGYRKNLSSCKLFSKKGDYVGCK